MSVIDVLLSEGAVSNGAVAGFYRCGGWVCKESRFDAAFAPEPLPISPSPSSRARRPRALTRSHVRERAGEVILGAEGDERGEVVAEIEGGAVAQQA